MKKNITISLKLKNNSYKIHIGYGLLEKNIALKIKKLNLGNYGIVLTSPKIRSLYNKNIKLAFPSKNNHIVTVADGEKAKTKEWLFKVISALLKKDGLGKKVFIICLGGGTIGDLGGFVASIYKRGIPYIQIPTTLLSQIDSSVGGKTGIDLNEAKNILGTFYHPKAVFIDPSFLNTLTEKEIKQGLSEAIKYGIIEDYELFNFLKDNHQKIMDLDPSAILKVISVCIQIKTRIVEKDEKEKKGIRTILNFGHTFAHALESSLKYKIISHGEAVSLGMIYAARLSLSIGKCNRQNVQKISSIIKLFLLPSRINFNSSALYKSLCYDKKFTAGKIRMVVLKKIGKVEVVNEIKSQTIKKILAEFNSNLVDN